MKRNLNRSWDFSDALLEDYIDNSNNSTIDIEAEKKDFEDSVRSSEWFDKLDIDKAEFDIYSYDDDSEVYGVLRLYKTFNGKEAKKYIYQNTDEGPRYGYIDDIDYIKFNWLHDNIESNTDNVTTTDGKYEFSDITDDSYENNLKSKDGRNLVGTFSVECTIEFAKVDSIEEGLTEGSVNSLPSPWDDVDADTLLTSYTISCGDDIERNDYILAKDALRNMLAFIRKHKDRIPEIMLGWVEGGNGEGDILVSVYSKDERRACKFNRRTLANWPEAERMIRNALHLHN